MSSYRTHGQVSRSRTKVRRHRTLFFDALEARRMLCGENCFELPLLSDFDQFGVQIETVMGYKLAGEADEQARISFALYDTGASVITVASSEQTLYELVGTEIPIKVPGGAVADAIGGTLIGDVSAPGEIIADGMHAVSMTGDMLEMGIHFGPDTARTPGVQVFVGTDTGSPALPTITGTVIHSPSAIHPQGNAAWVDMTAYKFDFGVLFPDIPEFSDIVIDMPDLRFVAPGTKLTAPTDGTVTPVMRIPLEMWGESNLDEPGDSITYAPNPVQSQTSFSFGGVTSGQHTMLFDTGAQLTVISTEIALELGLNLDLPQTSVVVQGAAGIVDVPGFTIDTLEVPRDDNADGVIDGMLRFSNVPIYVLDVVPGLDGIIGMNLFNLAHGMLYDPYDPAGASLQLAFFDGLIRELPEMPDESEDLAIDMLTQSFPALNGAFGGQSVPSFGLDIPVANQAPTNITLDRPQVFDQTPGAWVSAIDTSDADAADTHTYSLSDSRFEVRSGQLYLKADQSLDAVVEPSIALDITATDSDTPARSISRTFHLAVSARPTDWPHAHQWKPRPNDVNLDGAVTPTDVVYIINALNAGGTRNLPVLAGGTQPGPFLDVSGDNVLSPLDALLVINHLNSTGAGEDTSAPPAVAATDDALLSFYAEEEAAPVLAGPDIGSSLMWLWLQEAQEEDACLSAISERSTEA